MSIGGAGGGPAEPAIKPIKVLYWTAVLNAALAVPVMGTMIADGLAARHDGPVCWISIAVMALALFAMLVTSF